MRSLIGERLPDAYLPARIIRLDGFPLTPNGKTDRGRLEADVAQHLAAALPSEVVAEVFDDATEQLVADVWTAELRRPVGRDDNFFDIGGNSLLAVAVFRRIGDRTDVPAGVDRRVPVPDDPDVRCAPGPCGEPGPDRRTGRRRTVGQRRRADRRRPRGDAAACPGAARLVGATSRTA